MPAVNISTVPVESTIHMHLDKFTRFKINKPVPDCPLKQEGKLIKFELPDGIDFAKLVADTNTAMEMYGQWNYRLRGEGNKDMSYGGIGLTYNPTHVDIGSSDIHEQVQGNHNPGTKGPGNPFTHHGTQEMQINRRNSHFDTYGFAYRTPASQYGELGRFIDTFKRTMVRTAVRIIYSEHEGPVGEDKFAGVTWHRDEAMPANLRINIPLATHPDYVLEQEGTETHHLEAGYAYTWDTNTLHRAYCKTRTAPPRIHLMLGFSCWWDFNEDTQTWTTNEFAGVKHPLDMLVDGDVIPGLRLHSVIA